MAPERRICGGVMARIGQLAVAETLRPEEMASFDHLRQVHEDEVPLLFLSA